MTYYFVCLFFVWEKKVGVFFLLLTLQLDWDAAELNEAETCVIIVNRVVVFITI